MVKVQEMLSAALLSYVSYQSRMIHQGAVWNTEGLFCIALWDISKRGYDISEHVKIEKVPTGLRSKWI